MLSLSTTGARLFVTSAKSAHEPAIDHVLQPAGPARVAMHALPLHERPATCGIEQHEGRALWPVPARPALAKCGPQAPIQRRREPDGVPARFREAGEIADRDAISSAPDGRSAHGAKGP